MLHLKITAPCRTYYILLNFALFDAPDSQYKFYFCYLFEKTEQGWRLQGAKDKTIEIYIIYLSTVRVRTE
jgi:hypothetical protein